MVQRFSTLSWRTRVPMVVAVCGVGGMIAGGCMGFFGGSPLVVGAASLVGLAMGTASGLIAAREEARSLVRSNQLDVVIGVTGTSGLGASSGPRSAFVASLELQREQSRKSERELRAWITEWMTPAPPQASASRHL